MEICNNCGGLIPTEGYEGYQTQCPGMEYDCRLEWQALGQLVRCLNCENYINPQDTDSVTWCGRCPTE